jgi:hypothetical protein
MTSAKRVTIPKTFHVPFLLILEYGKLSLSVDIPLTASAYGFRFSKSTFNSEEILRARETEGN